MITKGELSRILDVCSIKMNFKTRGQLNLRQFCRDFILSECLRGADNERKKKEIPDKFHDGQTPQENFVAVSHRIPGLQG
jgi:hypothetical protein